VQVEVETLEQLAEAIAAGTDAVLLDNMDVETLAEAVQRAGGKIQLEASGGVTLENVGEVAATGVDLISVGALTHSARAVDMSMEIETT
jgi:nicotinate-nucleotide pyrophosphorylase (carboxylating)